MFSCRVSKADGPSRTLTFKHSPLDSYNTFFSFFQSSEILPRRTLQGRPGRRAGPLLAHFPASSTAFCPARERRRQSAHKDAGEEQEAEDEEMRRLCLRTVLNLGTGMFLQKMNESWIITNNKEEKSFLSVSPQHHHGTHRKTETVPLTDGRVFFVFKKEMNKNKPLSSTLMESSKYLTIRNVIFLKSGCVCFLSPYFLAARAALISYDCTNTPIVYQQSDCLSFHSDQHGCSQKTENFYKDKK